MATKTAEAPRFRSAYSGAVRKTISSGSEMENVYGYEIDVKGRKVLVKTGERNQYEEIQSHLENTKIENILKRAAVGDMSDFRPDGIYQDISDVPNNLNDARKEILKMENTFKGLPANVRAKYNNDVGMFIAQAGSSAWLKDMGMLPEAPTLKAEETKVETPTETKTTE